MKNFHVDGRFSSRRKCNAQKARRKFIQKLKSAVCAAEFESKSRSVDLRLALYIECIASDLR